MVGTHTDPTANNEFNMGRTSRNAGWRSYKWDDDAINMKCEIKVMDEESIMGDGMLKLGETETKVGIDYNHENMGGVRLNTGAMLSEKTSENVNDLKSGANVKITLPGIIHRATDQKDSMSISHMDILSQAAPRIYQFYRFISESSAKHLAKGFQNHIKGVIKKYGMMNIHQESKDILEAAIHETTCHSCNGVRVNGKVNMNNSGNPRTTHKRRVQARYNIYELSQVEAGQSKVVCELRKRLEREVKVPQHHFEPIEIRSLKAKSAVGAIPDFILPRYDAVGPYGHRVATLITFLSTSEAGAGGEVLFPLAFANSTDRTKLYASNAENIRGIITRAAQESFTDICRNPNNTVVRSHAKLGSAVLYYHTHVSGKHDDWSMYAHCPLYHGEVWMAVQHVAKNPVQLSLWPHVAARWKTNRLEPGSFTMTNTVKKGNPMKLKYGSPRKVNLGGNFDFSAHGQFCATVDLSPLGVTRALLLLFMVKQQSCNGGGAGRSGGFQSIDHRKNTYITLSTAEAETLEHTTKCCGWKVRVSRKCKVDVFGPDRPIRHSLRPASLKLNPNTWTPIAVSVVNAGESLDYIKQYSVTKKKTTRKRNNVGDVLGLDMTEKVDDHLISDTEEDIDVEEEPPEWDIDDNADPASTIVDEHAHEHRGEYDKGDSIMRSIGRHGMHGAPHDVHPVSRTEKQLEADIINSKGIEGSVSERSDESSANSKRWLYLTALSKGVGWGGESPNASSSAYEHADVHHKPFSQKRAISVSKSVRVIYDGDVDYSNVRLCMDKERGVEIGEIVVVPHHVTGVELDLLIKRMSESL
eukprot:CFRG5691T1